MSLLFNRKRPEERGAADGVAALGDSAGAERDERD